MYQFIETLRIEDGNLLNIEKHQSRVDKTLAHFWPGKATGISLKELLPSAPCAQGIFKVRVVYGGNGIEEIKVEPYQKKIVRTLRLVENNDACYPFKSTDRSVLTQAMQKRGVCDEVIIVKNGLLTDTSYTNIALFDGHHWYTPAYPLLAGTMREKLLDNGIIRTRDIKASDICQYSQISLFNAMIDHGGIVLPTTSVITD